MNKRPILSVAVITYNQQDTIAQTLDSILCQKGDFDLEVVIGEDGSTDGTLAICKEYADRFPGQVILLSGQKNLGIIGNCARTARACSGDYYNIIGGDDYWCDEHKLDKQLHFLQGHPEYGAVSTNGFRLLVKSGRMVEGLPPETPSADGDIRKFYYDRYGGVYAMPLTLMVRSDLMKYVDWDEFVRRDFPVEDYPIQCVLAHHTRFGYIPDKTAVYRVSGQSATFIGYDHPRYLEYHRGLADVRRYLNGLFPQDVPFSEEWASDYVFYKEFLRHLHKGQLKNARKDVHDAPQIIRSKHHYLLSKRVVSSWPVFQCFRIYKRLQEHRDFKGRTER